MSVAAIIDCTLDIPVGRDFAIATSFLSAGFLVFRLEVLLLTLELEGWFQKTDGALEPRTIHPDHFRHKAARRVA